MSVKYSYRLQAEARNQVQIIIRFGRWPRLFGPAPVRHTVERRYVRDDDPSQVFVPAGAPVEELVGELESLQHLVDRAKDWAQKWIKERVELQRCVQRVNDRRN